MKKLKEIYDDINEDVNIKGVSINSKEISKGDIFVCTKGVTTDRHDFIDEAIKNGASAIVVSRKDIKKSVPTVYVEDTNKELPRLCAKLYDYPYKKLKMIGVTGTDGKTSCTTVIQTLLGDDICGYIGTNGCRCKDYFESTPNTTPDVHKLYKYLDTFVQKGCKEVAMETSSEAFFRNRLNDIEFDISLLTNITSDHLNIHKTLENYIECKSKLFKQTKKDGICILNKDDKSYDLIKEVCNGKILTYGKGKDNDLIIKDYTINPHKTYITYTFMNNDYFVETTLLGEFNIYNLAGSILVALSLGVSFEDIIERCKNLKVDGRLDLVKTNSDYFVMVDYAHTPNGITNLLKFVHTLDINRSIVVIGSAGERDYLKRPIMGRTLLENASYVIFTYEDPRSEDPKNIIDMMLKGNEEFNNYDIVIDRKEAIKKAIMMAKDKDMVLILGKGNETYQKLKDKTIYFNDIEEAKQAIKEKEKLKDLI